MANATELRGSSVRGLDLPTSPLKRLGRRVLKARYSLLDVALAVALIGVIVMVMASSRMWDYKRQIDEAVFESPLPAVRLAEQRTTPDSVAYKRAYDFTNNWFSANIPIWEKALAGYKGKADVHYLEVGVFEGRSALWTLENILTHPTARLTCIDLFDGPYKERFFANVERSGEAGKVAAIADYSQLALRKLPLNSFDIIYIDGSHSKDDVLEDAVLSWRLLKEGGIMIFDDYRWAGFYASGTSDAPTDYCKAAIDRFVLTFDRDFEVIHNSYQILLKKRPRTR
jgi:predicted O-methyltransferase YrrM